MNHNYNPYTIGKGEHYIPSMNSLNRVYTQHPEFKPSTKLIYELLFDYWNPNYGYSFPTIRQLERDSGLGNATVKRQISTLIKLDLIEKERSLTYGNNVYRVKKPVQTLEQLFEKFPEIEKKANERLERIEAKAHTEKERWEKSREEGAQEKTEEVIEEMIHNPDASDSIDEDWF